MIKVSNIEEINQDSCTGCGCCAQCCPSNAIILKKNNEGFLYPTVLNEKCIECGICLKKCHLHTSIKIDHDMDYIFAGKFIDNNKLCESSSGGAATAIAEMVISNGGYAFGVTFDEDYKSLKYICIDDIKELKKIKNSKYVQSIPPDYSEILEKVHTNNKVVFFGLPCQCDALINYFGNKPDNLLVVSLVCHGPTSELVLEKYIEELEQKGKIKTLQWRYKYKGKIRPSRVLVNYQNGRKEIKYFATSSFGYAFEILNRKSCEKCRSKYPNGLSDIIIGDFWGGSKDNKKQDNYGESLILIRNNKYLDLKDALIKYDFSMEEAEFDKLEIKNPAIYKSRKQHPMRGKLINELQSKSLTDAINSCVPYSIRIKMNIYTIFRSNIPNEIWEALKHMRKRENNE
ncbi:Coenzyme F420 hydrogenase/dehydrogenase, beta subunit C-terminal domain [Blautia producta]|uniref:Coenzyme F420 hydrogenase/dehydrogenase, beta subunit C-terminal domain n=1 Tax=Blautia producta TaxID=33035 RepID=UPI0031B60E32